MTEVDLFVDLIDENEADRILEIFHENSKLGSLQFKKTKIRKIFRGMNTKINSFHKMNPFDYIISSNTIPELKTYSEKEFFIIMKDKRTDNIPDYKKLSNAIAYFPDKTQKLLDAMEENIKKQKPVFELEYKFETDEEVEKFLLKTAVYNSEIGFNRFTKNIESLLDDDDREKLKELTVNEENWNVIDFYNRFFDDENLKKSYLCQYAYLTTHMDMKKNLKYFFMLDIQSGLLNKCISMFKDMMKNNEELSIDSENTKISSDIQSEMESLKKQIESCKKAVKKGEDKNKKLSKKLEEAKKDQAQNEISITKLNSKIESKEESIEKLNETIKKYKQETAKLKKGKESAERELDDMKFYEKYNFESDENCAKSFAVIYSSDIRLAKIIFPEILFIQHSKWKEEIKKEKSIKKIFIKRDGMTSGMVSEIMKYSKVHNIGTQILITISEKELIEKLSCIKQNGGN